jgi:AraC-like DNA-binding protein
MVRERPASVAVVDVDAVGRLPSGRDALGEIRSSYPRLGLVLLVRQTRDAVALFDLGRVGVRNLVFINVDGLEHQIVRAVARAGENGATAVVTRTLSAHLSRRELLTVHRAMDSVHRRWDADAFAESVDLSRPFLSEVLKARGLPSVGHLLLWTRLLHAGLWLSEPGRTGESVSRQLEYSSGAAFRRALKHYTGATPTQVVERGGLDFVLSCFLRACRLGPRGERASLTVA